MGKLTKQYLESYLNRPNSQELDIEDKSIDEIDDDAFQFEEFKNLQKLILTLNLKKIGDKAFNQNLARLKKKNSLTSGKFSLRKPKTPRCLLMIYSGAIPI